MYFSFIKKDFFFYWQKGRKRIEMKVSFEDYSRKEEKNNKHFHVFNHICNKKKDKIIKLLK